MDPKPQIPQYLGPLNGFYLRVEIVDLDSEVKKICAEVFSHLFCEGCHQHSLLSFGALFNLVYEVIDLPRSRFYFDFGVQQAGRPDKLLGDSGAMFHLVRAGGRGDEHGLVDQLLELAKAQGAIVQRRRKPEPILDQNFLAGSVPRVHPMQLRDRLVAFVDEQQKVVGEILYKGMGSAAGRAAIDYPRVVFDAVAVSQLPQHLHVEPRALLNPLSLQQPAVFLEISHPILEFLFDFDK